MFRLPVLCFSYLLIIQIRTFQPLAFKSGNPVSLQISNPDDIENDRYMLHPRAKKPIIDSILIGDPELLFDCPTSAGQQEGSGATAYLFANNGFDEEEPLEWDSELEGYGGRLGMQRFCRMELVTSP